MSQTSIITGQYVRIQQTAATVVQRFFAWVIDAVFLSIASLIFGAITISISAADDIGDVVLTVIFSLALLLYPMIMEMSSDGQTIGKSIMGIKVICLDGSRPSRTALFLRWVLYLVDLGCMCVGLVVIVFTKNSQRLGDLAAGTTMVKLSKSKRPFILRSFGFTDRHYVPAYPEAARLSLRQISVIEQLLYSGNQAQRQSLMIQLAEKTEHLLGIRAKESESEKFLIRIYNDFQYFSTQ